MTWITRRSKECGTNPRKTKRKARADFEECDVSDAQVVKAEEKPTFVKNCMRNLNSAVALASATSKSTKTTPKKPEDNRYTLDRSKLYLDCCATYHSFFAKEFLPNIEYSD